MGPEKVVSVSRYFLQPDAFNIQNNNIQNTEQKIRILQT